jgi:hypothetical protein
MDHKVPSVIFDRKEDVKKHWKIVSDSKIPFFVQKVFDQLAKHLASCDQIIIDDKITSRQMLIWVPSHICREVSVDHLAEQLKDRLTACPFATMIITLVLESSRLEFEQLFERIELNGRHSFVISSASLTSVFPSIARALH